MKRIVTIIAAIAVLFALVGCGNEYNAELYSHARNWFTIEFLRENRICGAGYPREGYVKGESDPNDKYRYDENAPETRTVIFTESEDFEKVFTNKNISIDFDREIAVVHVFASSYDNYSLDKVELDGQTLKVYYDAEDDFSCDSFCGIKAETAPIQECLLLKLDKCDFTAAQFIEKD